MELSPLPAGLTLEQIVVYELGSIKAELKAIHDKLDSKETAQDDEIKSLKADVSKLKHHEALRLGAAAAISFIIGIATKVLPWQNLF